jgi:hypothetical protein
MPRMRCSKLRQTSKWYLAVVDQITDDELNTHERGRCKARLNMSVDESKNACATDITLGMNATWLIARSVMFDRHDLATYIFDMTSRRYRATLCKHLDGQFTQQDIIGLCHGLINHSCSQNVDALVASSCEMPDNAHKKLHSILYFINRFRGILRFTEKIHDVVFGIQCMDFLCKL